MASPQLKNGHVRIANELLEAIYKFNFSSNGIRSLFWIIRQSYGWNKKTVNSWSYRKASEDLNMPISSVHLALQVLLDAGVIKKDENDSLSLNKDYETWSSVQPTERSVAFSPLNESVQPTERGVQPTEHYIKDVKDIKRKDIKDSGIEPKTGYPKTIPPKHEWVVAYCNRDSEIKGRRIDPDKFMAAMESSGWYRGKTKIKDWQATIRTWEMNEFSIQNNNKFDTKKEFDGHKLRKLQLERGF